MPVKMSADAVVDMAISQSLGYQQITDDQLSGVMGLMPPDGAVRALIQSNGQQSARWRDDGVDPTSTTGIRIYGGDALNYIGDLTTFRITREQSGAVLDIMYYG